MTEIVMKIQLWSVAMLKMNSMLCLSQRPQLLKLTMCQHSPPPLTETSHVTEGDSDESVDEDDELAAGTPIGS